MDDDISMQNANYRGHFEEKGWIDDGQKAQIDVFPCNQAFIIQIDHPL